MFFRHVRGENGPGNMMEDTAGRPRGPRGHCDTTLCAQCLLAIESGCDGGAVICSLAALYVVASTGSTTRTGVETTTPRTRTIFCCRWCLEQLQGQGKRPLGVGRTGWCAGGSSGLDIFPSAVVHFTVLGNTNQVSTCHLTRGGGREGVVEQAQWHASWYV